MIGSSSDSFSSSTSIRIAATTIALVVEAIANRVCSSTALPLSTAVLTKTLLKKDFILRHDGHRHTRHMPQIHAPLCKCGQVFSIVGAVAGAVQINRVRRRMRWKLRVSNFFMTDYV